MSVLIVTSLGDLVVDLYPTKCPLTCKNFLKLCKIKYYNGCLFHTVQKDFTAQTGDPTGTGTAGDSIYKFLYGEQARFFSDEIHLDLKHSKTGTLAMASSGENLNASQFYFTLRNDLDYLDGKHTVSNGILYLLFVVFGEVAEGLETLTRINEAYVDEKNRPYKNIRIKHTYILDDPFDDTPQLAELIPDTSPEGKPKDEVDSEVRLEDDWVPLDEQLGTTELEEVFRTKEAHSSAVVLESIGDIPDAEINPPDNVLFVCKLNPVTEDEDLHTIFSRFGTVTSADIIRDYKTGDSLCYAFIEFETKEACEQAYFKMDNALIDDRRIHVDFSQSVAKLWSQYRRKANQIGKGKGCFKCGAPDHMAGDCTGDPAAKQLPGKYIMKDNNTQHGDDKSRYEMVFDGYTPDSSVRETRHRVHDPDDLVEKQKMNKRSDLHYRDQEKRDSSDGYRHSDRSRGHRDDVIDRDSRRSRSAVSKRDLDFHNDWRDKEKFVKKRREKDDIQRDELDYRKRSAGHGDRREIDGDYRKRTVDDDNHSERRNDGNYRRRNTDDDRHADRRGDRVYRKRIAGGDIHGYPGEDRDSMKHGDSDRGDTRDQRSHRK